MWPKAMTRYTDNGRTKMPHGLLQGDDVSTKRLPSLAFIMNDLVRGGTLRLDFEMPPLSRFLRYQGAFLTMWP
jgi:hypothetical protein